MFILIVDYENKSKMRIRTYSKQFKMGRKLFCSYWSWIR